MPLTDDEKNKLREEVEYRVETSRALEPPKSFFYYLGLITYHPVTITLLGGLILACVSAKLQHSYAISQQELLYQQQLRDNKIRSLSNFAEQFEQQFNVLYNIHRQRIYVNKLANSSDARDKKKLKNEIESFNKLTDEDMKNHHIISTIYSVQVLFGSSNIRTSAENLEKQVTYMIANDNLSDNEYIEIGNNVYKNFKDLLKNMGNEIDGSLPKPSHVGWKEFFAPY